ncbi:hypothetical protein QBC39DRAFT_114096 [Podospora conica]|nr:hypothetical protein QBC39DRAFT_114096 [Schizothecium conicum]
MCCFFLFPFFSCSKQTMRAGTTSQSTVRRPSLTQTTPELQSLQCRLHTACLHAACWLSLALSFQRCTSEIHDQKLGPTPSTLLMDLMILAVSVGPTAPRHPIDPHHSGQSMRTGRVGLIPPSSQCVNNMATLDNHLGLYHVTAAYRCFTVGFDAQRWVQPAILPIFPAAPWPVQDGREHCRRPLPQQPPKSFCKETMCRHLDQSCPQLNMNPFPL